MAVVVVVVVVVCRRRMGMDIELELMGENNRKGHCEWTRRGASPLQLRIHGRSMCLCVWLLRDCLTASGQLGMR